MKYEPKSSDVVCLFRFEPMRGMSIKEAIGRVAKIVSPLLDRYFYTNEYVEELVNSISVDEVLKNIV